MDTKQFGRACHRATVAHRVAAVLGAVGMGFACTSALAAVPANGPLKRAAPRADAPVPGLIVKLREVPATSIRRETAQQERVRLTRAFDRAPLPAGLTRDLADRTHTVRWARPLDAAEAARQLAALQANPEVEWAVADSYEHAQQASGAPNDPLYADQWWLSAGATGGAPGIASAWSSVAGGDIPVAVLDTGLRRAHPDLGGTRFATGYDLVTDEDGTAGDGDGPDADFDDPGDATFYGECTDDPTYVQESSWHGSFIAGQIGAVTGNAVGVAGVNPSARVVSVRVAGKCGALVSDIVAGMRWAAGLTVSGVPANPYPARIVNISFGSANTDCTPYQSTIDALRSAGVLVIAAAGNSSAIVHRPARCSGVLAVGAVTRSGVKTSYSNAGAQVGLSTVGGDFDTTYGDGGLMSTLNTGVSAPLLDSYGVKSGTSFSTPIVSGVASLMLAVNPSLTVDQLVEGLKTTARPHVTGVAGLSACAANVEQGHCLCTTGTCGAGLLDAPAAVAWAANPASGPDDGDGGDDGGGGGALGLVWLLGVSAAVLALARTRRRH